MKVDGTFAIFALSADRVNPPVVHSWNYSWPASVRHGVRTLVCVSPEDVARLRIHAQNPLSPLQLVAGSRVVCDPARIKQRSETLPTIPGDLPDLVELPVGCIFADRCPASFAPCRGLRPLHHRVAPGHSAACHLLAEEPADA